MNEYKETQQQENETEKKSASFFKKASEAGKKVAENVQDMAKNRSQKIQEDKKEKLKNKLRPLTMKEFKNKKFDIPNIIKIIDDAEIRDIDVCEGAIGRLVNASDVEILYLCDTAVNESGLNFVPSPVCNAIYHVDNFDRSKFVCTDEIFSKALEEKLAELEHIAYCLGAKFCSIEIMESDANLTEAKKNFSGQIGFRKNQVKSSVSSETATSNKRENSGRIESIFSGEVTPKLPPLKWFAHNDNIKNLIDMRLSEGGSVSKKILQLKGSSSASMTQKAAVAIDAEIMKMGIKAKKSVEKQAQVEKNSILIFEVQF